MNFWLEIMFDVDHFSSLHDMNRNESVDMSFITSNLVKLILISYVLEKMRI